MFTFVLYWLAQQAVTKIPRRTYYWLAERVADLYFFFSHRDKTTVMGNLEVIFGRYQRPFGQKKRELKSYARKVFRNFAKYLADFLNSAKINKGYLETYVRVTGREYMDRLLKQGKGVIAVTAHLGNWELGGMVVALLGYPINAIALVHENRRVNRLFLGQRSRNKVKVIPPGMAVKRCFSALARGEILALLGDRDFSGSGVKTSLFGRATFVPRGAAELSLKTGAPILPAFMIREPDDGYRLIFEKPIGYHPSGDSKKDLVRITEEIIAVVEKYISRYPTQWYMFERFWCASG